MTPEMRQQVLFLWLDDSALDSRVVAWAHYDGVADAPDRDADAAPYGTGLDALRDGWRLIQVAPLLPAPPGTEHQTSHLKHEFVFEKLRPAP